MKGLTLPGADTGVGVVDWHRRAIGLGIATEEFGARWYDEGTAPQSILETDEKMTSEAANNELARWIATHQGRRRPALLHSGLKWRPISLTPNESQFIETMRNNSARIAKLFRVPPHMIGETERSTSWGSGIEEQGIGFVVYTLGIWIARLEAAMFPFLPRPQSLKINVAGLLRGNTRDRYLAYAIGRQWGWMSVNDIRALEDLPPVEGGDVYLQPLNMIDAQDALKVLLGPNNTGGGGA
jgi:HK97 family phage portal protein